MRRFKGVKVVSSLAIALVVASHPLTIPYVGSGKYIAAAAGSDSAYDAEIPVIDSVTLNNLQSVDLSDITVYPDGKNNRVTFTLTFHNNNSVDMDFINYWVRLQSAAGQSYSVSLLPQDKQKNKIPSLSSETFSFYANVGKEVSLQDLRFKLIQWDFSIAGYERTLGTLQVPDDFVLETKPDQWRTAWVNQIKTTSKVKSMRIAKQDKSNQVSIKYILKNIDALPLSVPELQFKLKTSNGLMYPLKATVLTKDALIQPLEEKEATLTGNVPSEVTLDGAQLVITKTDAVNNNTFTTAIAYYQLMEKKLEAPIESTEQLFSTASGSYGAIVNHISRVPWDDKDIAVLDVTITNKGKESVPVPQLGSYLMIDDSVKVESQNIRMDKGIALKPDQSVNVQIIGKIPYTYEFDRVKLVLQELSKEGDKTSSSDVAEIMVKADYSGTPTVAPGDSYVTDNKLMDSITYAVSDVQRYSSENESIYMVQVEMTNSDKRQLSLNNLVGYFKMSDGVTVAAVNVTNKGKIPPNGKTYLYFYTVIPQSYELDGGSLIIGRAVSDGKLAEGEAKADAYVNAVNFGLPQEKKQAQDNFKNIRIGNYTLNFNKIKTSIYYKEEQANLEFDYQLNKNLLLATDPATHKVEVELVDPVGKVRLTETFDLEKGGTSLLLGKQTAKVSKVQENLATNIYSLKKYTLNIYDLIQIEGGENNFKRLVASRELDWYVESD